MRRWKSILMALAMLAAMMQVFPAAAEGEKLTVYASFYPMYDFASKVGGDKVTVVNMMPPGTDAHSWEPTASDIIGLENADVFVYNGAGMEQWVDKVLASLSNKDLKVVNASENAALLEGDAHHHDEDDDQGEETADHGEEEETGIDPHVWLAPEQAKVQMKAIAEALSLADPDNAEYYTGNYDTWAAELDALDAEFQQALAPLANKQIVVSHQAFGYLCAAYGLEQVGIEGLTPDYEPSPARMAEIIDFVKEHQVTTIFFEELASPKVAETISSATGAVTDTLSPIASLTQEQIAAGEDYFSMMRKNLAALVKALQ